MSDYLQVTKDGDVTTILSKIDDVKRRWFDRAGRPTFTEASDDMAWALCTIEKLLKSEASARDEAKVAKQNVRLFLDGCRNLAQQWIVE